MTLRRTSRLALLPWVLLAVGCEGTLLVGDDDRVIVLDGDEAGPGDLGRAPDAAAAVVPGDERETDATFPPDDPGPQRDAGAERPPPAFEPDAGSPVDGAADPDPDAAPEPDAFVPPPPRCGDGVCSPGESCEACDADCGRCGWPETSARMEEELLVGLNAVRARGASCGGVPFGPTGPLRMNPELREAARLHSLDMGTRGYFDHVSLDGRSFAERAGAAGYRGGLGAENIAAGNGTAAATLQQWLDSPGHCQNMLSPQFDEIGVGHARVAGSPWGDYWTQVFGRGR